MNKHLNKTIALIVAVIVGLFLIHNLYMYEINYGVKIGSPEIVAKTQHSKDETDQAKFVFAIFIIANAIALTGIIVERYTGYSGDWEFDPSEWSSDTLGCITFLVYIMDGLIIFALLSYLLYLVL